MSDRGPWTMTFQKVKGGSDVYLGSLLIASLTFGRKSPDGQWPVWLNTYHIPPQRFPNMREALLAFHAQLREPPPGATP